MNKKITKSGKRHDGELGRINDRSGFAFHGGCIHSFIECLNTRMKSNDCRTPLPSRLNGEIVKRNLHQFNKGASAIKAGSTLYWH